MKRLLSLILTQFGTKGRFWDLLGVKFPTATKAVRVQALKCVGKKVTIKISVVDLDKPLETLEDVGVVHLDFSEEQYVDFNMDAETVTEGRAKLLSRIIPFRKQ